VLNGIPRALEVLKRRAAPGGQLLDARAADLIHVGGPTADAAARSSRI
jgi:hypothetical protein